jgi:hypothetical protein
MLPVDISSEINKKTNEIEKAIKDLGYNGLYSNQEGTIVGSKDYVEDQMKSSITV